MKRITITVNAAIALCLLFAGVALAAERSATPSVSYTLLRSGVSQGTHPSKQACITALERQRLADATRTSGQIRFVCREDDAVTVQYGPNPTCPVLPAPQGRVVDCPAGFTGAYTQTKSWTAAPYPGCATEGEWTPTAPPAGSCVPVPPPPTGDWTLCATEYQTCTFAGSRRVRFGLNATWVERDLAGPIACRVNTFGSDPVPGVAKRCELRNVEVSPVPTVTRACSSRVCDVSWTPNGPADGFRVFYSRTDGTWANAPVQVVGTISRTNVTMPETGIWYFAVKSFTGGTESELSNVVVRDVQ
jgi:hypothetical protein